MAFRTRARPRSRLLFQTKQPHQITFVVAFVLAVLALISTRIHIDYVSANAFWFMAAAYVVLALGNLIVGL